MLSDFFRINLPYGIAKNHKGEWMAFNREYLPLGYNNMSLKGLPGESYQELPIHTMYKNVPEKLLLELAWDPIRGVERNDQQKIIKIFLYNDGSNPVNQSKDNPELWDNYFNKIKKLSKLQRANALLSGSLN